MLIECVCLVKVVDHIICSSASGVVLVSEHMPCIANSSRHE